MASLKPPKMEKVELRGHLKTTLPNSNFQMPLNIAFEFTDRKSRQSFNGGSLVNSKFESKKILRLNA